jgi:ATP-dependent Lon protease
VLPVEVMALPGAGKLVLTGRLGEVMQESARIALSYARSRATFLGLNPEFADHLDFHLHIAEGAIPKDGPSAGVCLAVAVVSALTRVPVRRDVAMTGEITLSGEVLGIGGLPEKVVAARLAGYGSLLIPRENEPDWQEIAPEARRGLRVTFVDHVDDVIRGALAPSTIVDRLVAVSKSSRETPSEGLPGIAH